MNTLNKKAALPFAARLRPYIKGLSGLDFNSLNGIKGKVSPEKFQRMKILQNRGLTRKPLLQPYKQFVTGINGTQGITKALELPAVSGALDNLKNAVHLAQIRGLDIPNLRYLGAQATDAAKIKYIRNLVRDTANGATAKKPSLIRRFINRLLKRHGLKSSRAFTPTEAGILGIPKNVVSQFGVFEQAPRIRKATQRKAAFPGKKQLQDYSQGNRAYLDSQLAGTRARLNQWRTYSNPLNEKQLSKYLYDMQHGYYSKAYADNAWKAAYGDKQIPAKVAQALQAYSIYRHPRVKQVADDIIKNQNPYAVLDNPEYLRMIDMMSAAATPSIKPTSAWSKVPDYTL